MTDKICKKCGNYQENGKYCEHCGSQLYPDIGFTQWQMPDPLTSDECLVIKPKKFDRWKGESVHETSQEVISIHPKDGEP